MVVDVATADGANAGPGGEQDLQVTQDGVEIQAGAGGLYTCSRTFSILPRRVRTSETRTKRLDAIRTGLRGYAGVGTDRPELTPTAAGYDVSRYTQQFPEH